jgi:hypothetical protein
MELTYAQKEQIYERGFVKVAGVVPRVMVEGALRAINHSIGNGMHPDQMTKFRAQSYCPELQDERAITGLLTETPAWRLAESVVGEGKLQPARSGQIAIRFPSLQDPPLAPRPHLDGMHSPTNGVPEGVIRNFTMLVAVFLSNVPRPYSGNFTVWPGTHHCYEEYFREHGPRSLLDGMPPIELPEPEQVTAHAGDVAIVHYQLAHSAAVNVSPYPRYAIFFRLSHVEHEARRWEAMTDIWLEWEGMAPLLRERAGAAVD